MIKYEFSIEQQEDEDLRCPICNYYFSNTTKPYLLPCNHNLCLKCIDSIIAKKMFNCPICRSGFTEEDRMKFQVNFAFLNLVIKILKTKVIYCPRCSKIFNWIDHHSTCNQNEFKETNEIKDEIKNLADECYLILKYMERHKNVLDKSKREISECSQMILNTINSKFNEGFSNTLETFFKNIPDLKFDLYIKRIQEFLHLCQPSKTPDGMNNYFTLGGMTMRKSFDGHRELTDSDFMDDTKICYHQRGRSQNALAWDQLLGSNYLQSEKKTANRLRSTNTLYRTELISKVNLKPVSKFQVDDVSYESKNCEDNCECESFELEEEPNLDLDEVGDMSESFRNNFTLEDKTKIKINTPKRMELSIKNSETMFNRNSNDYDKGKIINVNFSISDVFKRESTNQNVSPDKSKPKIIVQRDKVEIIDKSLKESRTNIIMSGDVSQIKTERKSLTPINFCSDNVSGFVNKRHSDNLPSTFRIKQENEPEQQQEKGKLQKIYLPNTPKSNQELINRILSHFNHTKEITQKILNYTNQVEFTTETIKRQINTNFNNLNSSITRGLNGIFDNITVNFKTQTRRYLANLIENTKKIWLFDTRKMKCETREFDFLKFKLNNSMSVEYDETDLLFITGGRSPNGLFTEDGGTDQFLIIRWSNEKSFESTGHMPRKRANHSSLYFDTKLYVIGGMVGDKRIKECECYNLADKRWELMPSLNTARCNPSLCVYNQTYLYAFRGNGENTEDTIEFLNIRDMSLGWLWFKPEDPGMCWDCCILSSVTVIAEDKILICGGVNSLNNYNNSKSYLTTTFIFDPIKKTVYRSKDLTRPAIFDSPGVWFENTAVMIDVKNDTSRPFGVHVYDIESNTWKFNQS